MGSKFAIDRLVRACQNHPIADLVYFTKEPSQSRFSFANGQQSSVHEKLVIHFRNDDSPTGWVTTAVDILDQGDVPILFSVAQMRNLRMNIEHTPACDFLTCTLFGMKRYPLPVSTSDHTVLDIMHLKRSQKKPSHSFHSDSSYVTCPACQGKHRARTYKDGCRAVRHRTHLSQLLRPSRRPKARLRQIQMSKSTLRQRQKSRKSLSLRQQRLASLFRCLHKGSKIRRM